MKYLRANRWVLGFIFSFLALAGLIYFNSKSYVSPTVSRSSLSIENLKNASYKTDKNEFELTNGNFTGTNDFSATLETESIAYNSSEQPKADKVAVIITTAEGGTGRFEYLVLLGIQDGKPEYLSDVFLEDRAVIKNLSFSGDKISVEGTFHGTGDPSCCPSLEKTLFYQISADNKLTETK